MVGASLVACQALNRQLALFSPDADLHNEVIKELLAAYSNPRVFTRDDEIEDSESSDGSNDSGHIVEVFRKTCEGILHQ